MPSNIMSIDSDFPSFTGEESPQQQIRALHNYLFQLREGLQYSLRNLTAENFNSAALKELTGEQSDEVIKELQRLQKVASGVAADVDRLQRRIATVEAYGARLSTVEGDVEIIKDALEDLGIWQTDTGGRLDELEAEVTGEKGLKAQLSELSETVGTLKQAVRMEEDGTMAIGEKGKVLKLVGSVYVNGVLLEIKNEDVGGTEGEDPDGTEGENPGGTEGEDPGNDGEDDTGGTGSEVT